MKTLLATVFTIIFFTLSAQTDVDFQYDQSIKFHPVALSYSGYQI